MKFSGTWQIQEMDMWDEDFLNMEVQAHIQIEPNGLGTFQFGFVSGQPDGEVCEINNHRLKAGGLVLWTESPDTGLRPV